MTLHLASPRQLSGVHLGAVHMIMSAKSVVCEVLCTQSKACQGNADDKYASHGITKALSLLAWKSARHVAGGQPTNRYAQNLTLKYDGVAQGTPPTNSSQSKPSSMQWLVINAGTGAAIGGGALLGEHLCYLCSLWPVCLSLAASWLHTQQNLQMSMSQSCVRPRGWSHGVWVEFCSTTLVC